MNAKKRQKKRRGEQHEVALPMNEAPQAEVVRPRIGPLTFLREVRAEASRVTWPTRNETVITTIIVFIMVFLASIFFLLADQVLSWAVGVVLGLGS